MLYSVAFRLFTNGSISVQRGSTKIVLMITITFRKKQWKLAFKANRNKPHGEYKRILSLVNST